MINPVPLVIAFLLAAQPVKPVYVVWLYGAPNAWGVLAHSVTGDPIQTPAQAALTFQHWTAQIDAALGYPTQHHADIIWYSENGCNLSAVDTAQAIRRIDNRASISLNFSVPRDWTPTQVGDYLDAALRGDVPCSLVNVPFAYTLSLDFERPVFYGGRGVNAAEVNAIAARFPDETVYVYNFGGMIHNAPALAANVRTIYNGIGCNLDTLIQRYHSVEREVGREAGLMLFNLPHLGANQRNPCLPIGDMQTVANWLRNEHVGILAFQ